MRDRIDQAYESVQIPTGQPTLGVSEIGGGPQDLSSPSMKIVLLALYYALNVCNGTALKVYWIGFSGATDLFVLMQLASIMELKLSVKGVEIDAVTGGVGKQLISTLKPCAHTSIESEIGKKCTAVLLFFVLQSLTLLLYFFYS